MSEDGAFRPAWWLPGAHAQTIWPTVMRRVPLNVERQRVELPDGDFVDVDWVRNAPLPQVGERLGEGDGSTDAPTHGDTGHVSDGSTLTPALSLAGRGSSDGRPVVVILPGLQGSIESPPVRGLLAALHRHGFRAGVMHFRGASGEPNRLPRGYHAGDYHDAAHLVETLRAAWPGVPIYAVGLSLGGNALLKWLGETGAACPLDAAVAISVPFDLHACADRLERGLSRLYERHLLAALRTAVRDKFVRHDVPATLSITVADLDTLCTFRAFDDAVTAPLHGFAGADDYYTRCSSGQYLRGIAKPTLIIHARDDPFMTPAVVPTVATVSVSVTLDVYDHGGHVGFVEGGLFRPKYWLDDRVTTWLLSR
ncbi:MAG: hydrolase [Phycisphaera sp.]|nr:hydrolase [Phycisphaera sp.]